MAGRSTSRRVGLSARLRRVFDAQTSDPDEMRAHRLRLFLGLGQVTAAYYVCHDFSVGLNASASVLSLSFLMMSTAQFVLRVRKRSILASQILIIALCLVLGSNHLWDGQVTSLGFWMLPLVPMLAAYLLDLGVAKIYAYVSGALMVFWCLASSIWEIQSTFPDQRVQWILLRSICLILFSSFGIFSALDNARTSELVQRQNLLLARDEQNAARNERAKSTFLANMSHELRTATSGILALTHELAAKRMAPNSQRVVANMQDNAKRLMELLSGIIDLSMIESGAFSLSQEPLLVSDVLERVHQEHAEFAASQGIDLQTRIRCTPRTCLGDTQRLYQVFSALVQHALVSEDPKGGLEITLSSEAPGPASKPDHQHYRVVVRDDLRDDHSLSGSLGQTANRERCPNLTIARRLLHALGGRLWVRSRDGHRVRFAVSLELPLHEDAQFDSVFSSALNYEARHAEPLVSTAYLQEAALTRSVCAPESSNQLRVLIMYSAPLVASLAVASLAASPSWWSGLPTLSGGVWVMALVWSQSRQKRRHMANYLLIAALWLAATSQSLLDGQFRSEALWSLGLLPLVSAVLLGAKASFYALGLCLATVIAVGLAPEHLLGIPYQVDSLPIVAIQRSAHLFAFTVISMNITREYAAKLSHLRSQQKRLGLASARALHSEGVKSRFLANISEEIRAPMYALLSGADTLISDEKLDLESKASLETILRCGAHLASLLDEILARSRDHDTRVRCSNVPFDLCSLLSDARRLFQARANLCGLSLRSEGIQEPTWVRGDPTKTLQIVANLLSNAIRYSKDGSVTLGLALLDAPTTQNRGMACFEVYVKDRAHKRSRPLESRSSLQLRSRDLDATPLGLEISRDLARSMDAELSISSADAGQGSTFSLKLVLECTSAPETTQLSSWNAVVATPQAPDPSLGSTNVLLVDPCSGPDSMLLAALGARDCLVHQVDSCQRARALAVTQYFDLIIVDLSLPEALNPQLRDDLCPASQNRAPSVMVGLLSEPNLKVSPAHKQLYDTLVVREEASGALSTILAPVSTRPGRQIAG